ncbi:MAG: class I mannose-6-phosphate isomerase [Bryobacteraceae bacterium]|nr:class I mannose-6-phosphate isomerase [Solibacteraceae bacterium]MCL4844100.1 class I mannose-6-phosphate isomerase [Bryobacteraceae bacterium]MCO5349806.1 class I mannose-6-phosphate isomerase [Bryobacteraceae bacterium]
MPEQPVRLTPRFCPKIWGSTHLEPWFPSPAEPIGEVWYTSASPLPLLPKFLFTRERLSVQVHPNDLQARARGLDNGKTEMWQILRAEPGAVIALGFRKPVSRDLVRAAALSGAIEDLLDWIPVHAGDTVFVPAGTVHALGAGIVLCEIQQFSDTTYRLYDYGRPRELHLDEALSVADLGPASHRPTPAGALEDGALKRLIHCPFFDSDLLAADSSDILLTGPRHIFRLLLVLQGDGLLNARPYRAGDCWLLPESAGEVRLQPRSPSQFLRTGPPPRRGR